MKRIGLNWFKYLGLLGFLGLLGLVTSNVGYYGFFGFFGFFGVATIKSDERLVENINKACRNAFVVSILVFAAACAYGGVAGVALDEQIFAGAFMISFVLQGVVFTFSFNFYDRAGV